MSQARSRTQSDIFAHSFTDLMAGVAAIFLLIAVVFILIAAKRADREEAQKREYQEQIQALNDFRRKILSHLDMLGHDISRDPALTDLVNVDEAARRSDPFLLIVVFNRQKLLFPTQECELSDEQEGIVGNAAPRVVAHVRRFASELVQEADAQGHGADGRSGATVSMTLEGHTDQTSFFPGRAHCGIEEISSGCNRQSASPECLSVGFQNNVRLSGARAQNVFFAMRRAVNEEDADFLDRHFVVAGRGPVDPVDGRDWAVPRTDEEKELNRRVVLKIRAQPSLESIEGIAPPRSAEASR